jgi:hypothetical protein
MCVCVCTSACACVCACVCARVFVLTACTGVRVFVLHRACQALVLAPTRELAVQIRDVMSALGDYMGVKVHACVGGTAVREDVAALRDGVHVVIGTPGRVLHMIQNSALRLHTVSNARRTRCNALRSLLPVACEVVCVLHVCICVTVRVCWLWGCAVCFPVYAAMTF